MIRTFGLTHIALAVRDVDRSFRFYHDVFGMREMYRGDGWIQLQTPGANDVLVLQRDDEPATETGGIAHFGFRLVDPDDIDEAVRLVEAAGGTLRSRGDFSPGEPYAFVGDPDGYEVEIWYEP